MLKKSLRQRWLTVSWAPLRTVLPEGQALLSTGEATPGVPSTVLDILDAVQ